MTLSFTSGYPELIEMQRDCNDVGKKMQCYFENRAAECGFPHILCTETHQEKIFSNQ